MAFTFPSLCAAMSMFMSSVIVRFRLPYMVFGVPFTFTASMAWVVVLNVMVSLEPAFTEKLGSV